MTLTFIHGHSCMRNQKLLSIFLRNFAVDLDEIQSVARTCWLLTYLKLMLNLFVTVQGRGHCWWDLMKDMINIVMCQDTCERIYFKLGLILDTAKLYSLILVWKTVMFTEGHRVRRKVELVQSFCCKVAWISSNVHDGWLYKGGDYEEVLSCEYCSTFLPLYLVKIPSRKNNFTCAAILCLLCFMNTPRSNNGKLLLRTWLYGKYQQYTTCFLQFLCFKFHFK